MWCITWLCRIGELKLRVLLRPAVHDQREQPPRTLQGKHVAGTIRFMPAQETREWQGAPYQMQSATRPRMNKRVSCDDKGRQ